MWLVLVLTGCSTPIGVRPVDLRDGFAEQTASVLDSGHLSSTSVVVLYRNGLSKQFRQRPEAAIAALHAQAVRDDRRDTLFALAETCYARGDQLRRSPKAWEPRRARDFYLASAVYAYLFLFDPGHGAPPDPFERSFRVACDLYTLGLTRSLATKDGSRIQLVAGERTLPVGHISLGLDTNAFPFPLEEFQRFLPAATHQVRGTSVRLRDPGLGVPLIGVSGTATPLPITPGLPATVFLRVGGDLRSLSDGSARGTLELFATFAETVTRVADRPIPLQTDVTAPLAWSLQDSPLWDLGLTQFLSGIERFKSGTYLTQPYQPGRIPVVFVHGTASNPLWWAEMWNTLRSDPELRRNFQFWVYLYNTGNPLTYSAANFRDSISAKVHDLDPAGQDAALHQMVIVGHSQGGLLAKLAVTDTGDTLWRAAGGTTFDTSKLTPEQAAFVRRVTVFTPLPFVRRVVFISTPHRGSYLVKLWLQTLARHLIHLPGEVVDVSNDLVRLWTPSNALAKLRAGIPTSIDSMSPRNKTLLALADLPVAPGVISHSIIAIRGNGPPATGDDGVVKYTSAHVDYARSEFIVRSGHSCQGNPFTIEEVRRILLEHMHTVPAGTLAPPRAATP